MMTRKATKLTAICIVLYLSIYLIVWLGADYTCSRVGVKADVGLMMDSYCVFSDYSASAWIFRRKDGN